jgi:hypothetical protein
VSEGDASDRDPVGPQTDRGLIEWIEQRGAWRWQYRPDRGSASEGYAETRDDALQAIGAAAAKDSLRPGERRRLARTRWGDQR